MWRSVEGSGVPLEPKRRSVLGALIFYRLWAGVPEASACKEARYGSAARVLLRSFTEPFQKRRSQYGKALDVPGGILSCQAVRLRHPHAMTKALLLLLFFTLDSP